MALYLDGQKIISGGSGSGGHTIVDNEGVSLDQRTNLQFKGAYSEDNSVDDTTEVNVVREMTKAEFDELTDEEKTGFINITDITGGNDDRFQPVIFSEEEREIGVWIDGKPLYQKSFIFTSSLTISDNWTSTTYSITNIDNIADGIIYRVDCRGAIYIDTNVQSSTIYISTKSKNSTFGVGSVLTIRYTKTTDTAGSGQWTPQGVPAHHYSEDERIVGTWVDGSTLYEKTFSSSVYIGSTATQLLDLSSLNYNDIIDIKIKSKISFTNENPIYFNPVSEASGYVNSDGYVYAKQSLAQQQSGRTMQSYITIQYTKSST